MSDVEVTSYGEMGIPFTDHLLCARHIMLIPFTAARDHINLVTPRKWWSLGKVYLDFGPPPKYMIYNMENLELYHQIGKSLGFSGEALRVTRAGNPWRETRCGGTRLFYDQFP